MLSRSGKRPISVTLHHHPRIADSPLPPCPLLPPVQAGPYAMLCMLLSPLTLTHSLPPSCPFLQSAMRWPWILLSATCFRKMGGGRLPLAAAPLRWYPPTPTPSVLTLGVHLQVEATKPPKERREPPPPPPELDEPLPTHPDEIDAFNAKMCGAFNEKSLVRCQHCGRSMRCVKAPGSCTCAQSQHHTRVRASPTSLCEHPQHHAHTTLVRARSRLPLPRQCVCFLSALCLKQTCLPRLSAGY